MFKIILLFLLSTLIFAASEQEEQLQKVSLQLQWKYQFQFSGFIVAKEMGFYEKEGLDVELLEYNNTNSIQDLVDKKIDFAINNSIIIYENKKLKDVTLLATYFQRSPLVIITQPEIKDILDLKAKKIMMSKNNLQNSSLSMLLSYFSINQKNTTFIEPNFLLDDFIEKKVDAFVGFRSNELFELDKLGIAYNVIDPIEYGFSTNAINLFASTDTVKNNPQLIDKFLKATKKGWEYALEHMQEVALLIHEKYNPQKSYENLLYEAKVTKELMLLDLYDIGEINSEFVDKTFKQLVKSKKLNPNQKKDNLIYKKASNSKIVSFSKRERLWLNKHPVVKFSDVNWKPLSIIKDEKMYGILGDYLELLSQYSGITFKYVKSKSWSDVLNLFKNKEIDIIPGIGSSSKETVLGEVSSIYASYPIVIITNKEYSFLNSLDDLKDRTIVVAKKYTTYNMIVENYPGINLLSTDSIEDALLLVQSGKADAFVGHIATSLYILSKLQLYDLKVSGRTKFNFEHRYLIQSQYPELKSIINKVLKSIDEKEKNLINSNWINTKVDKKIDKDIVWKIVLIALGIIILLAWRQYVLRKYNRKLSQQAQILEQIHDSVIATKLDGTIIHWNNGSYILLGYTAKEMIGEHITKIYLEEDYDFLKKNIEILKKNGEKHATVRLVKKSGEIIYADLSLSLLKDENSKAYAMVGYSQDITERKKAEDILIEQKNLLDYQAHHDSLTGLPNRTLFTDRLHQGIEKAKRNNSILALFFIDLDRFKQINDSLGHEVGDSVLNIVTTRLNSVMRQEDTLARLGGDEFTVIMENLRYSQDASILAEKILKILEKAIEVKNHKLYVSCSIGISIYPKDGIDAIDLLKDADAAMYRAKEEGRNNYQFYSREMTAFAFERVVMESALRQAISQEEFIVYYQAQMNATNDTLIGMEALVRWDHPSMGIVSPAKFIPLAEDTGLIVDLDRIVMKQAMKQVSLWYKKGLNPGKLSLNLAAKQLDDENFLDKLQDMMKEIGFKTENLELEITEGDVMKNPESAIVKLKQIYNLGISIAIDDFGTGYSSLSYLKRFPITKLKIDQSFVRDIPDDEEDSAIVKAIIALGKSLNLNLIAEGVENIEQKEFLIENGCNNIQGYFYTRPLPADKMSEFLEY